MNASVQAAPSGAFGAWLRLMRLSNAPTAATGALVGAVVGARAAPGSLPAVQPTALCVAGVTLVYLGGMVMNDFFDQPVDRIERPNRPIVSGRVRPNAALGLGMALLATGVTALVLAATAAIPWALLLLACVMAYNLLHRSAVAGPLLMAACRALVPVIAAIACGPTPQPDWTLLGMFALPLGGYTLAISLVARDEAAHRRRGTASLTLPVAMSLAALCSLAPLGTVALRMISPLSVPGRVGYMACMAVAAWLLLRGVKRMVQPGRVPAGVMSWIAGFAAIDAASLILLGAPSLAAAALGATALTVLLQRRVAGS